ncbi:MAG: hypothetical protein ACYS0E_06835 [Planctomycetota bacterium]|jgi:hypothetical protein
MERALHEIPEDRLHDEREESELFQRLPADAQEEMRERWRREEGRHVDVIELRKQTWKIFMAEMAGCFVFFHFFGILRNPGMILVAIAGGGLTGAVAAAVRAGPLLYPVIAGVGYVATGGSNAFAAVGLVSFASMLGFVHRLQRFDGLES